MKKNKMIIYIIYSLIFILTSSFLVFYVLRTKRKNDFTSPTLKVSVEDNIITFEAEDNLSVYAFAYNTEDETPDVWFKASNKKVFIKTLRILNPGTYYFWVKDSNENISNKEEIVINCKDGNGEELGDSIYCPYSSVTYKGYRWHVLEDNYGYVKLFMDTEQLVTMAHCDTLWTSENCYYVDSENYDSYSWSKSMINEYLNKKFIKELDENVLKDESVCNDRSGQKGCNDNDGCGGYLASDINNEGYVCKNQFVASKVRLLTLSEYNKILNDLKDENKDWVYGKYKFWTMNAWREPIYAAAINEKGVFLVDQKTTQALEVRPVIVVKR